MNRISCFLGVALIASSMAAFAADSSGGSAGSTKAPSQGEVQQKGTSPSASDLDANAQRAHDPATGSDSGANSANSAARSGGSSGTSATNGASGGTRDWAAVDANHDNLIQPEEMEAALKEVGPQAKNKK